LATDFCKKISREKIITYSQNTSVGAFEMNFGLTLDSNLCNAITHNVIWVNQKTGLLVYQWLRTLEMLVTTSDLNKKVGQNTTQHRAKVGNLHLNSRDSLTLFVL